MKSVVVKAMDHDQDVAISLQPGSDGNVFATAGFDHVIRLFDTRRKPLGESSFSYFCTLPDASYTFLFTIRAVPVLETGNANGPLMSVVFSPADPSFIAVSGIKGTRILDIRNFCYGSNIVR